MRPSVIFRRPQVYEIGAGKVLCGLAKRIVVTLEARPIGTPEDIDAVIAALSTK